MPIPKLVKDGSNSFLDFSTVFSLPAFQAFSDGILTSRCESRILTVSSHFSNMMLTLSRQNTEMRQGADQWQTNLRTIVRAQNNRIIPLNDAFTSSLMILLFAMSFSFFINSRSCFGVAKRNVSKAVGKIKSRSVVGPRALSLP